MSYMCFYPDRSRVLRAIRKFSTPATQFRERMEKFRLGNDQLLVDPTGQSKISVQDYAVAMIDELERPTHLRHRFTVGY